MPFPSKSMYSCATTNQDNKDRYTDNTPTDISKTNTNTNNNNSNTNSNLKLYTKP